VAVERTDAGFDEPEPLTVAGPRRTHTGFRDALPAMVYCGSEDSGMASTRQVQRTVTPIRPLIQKRDHQTDWMPSQRDPAHPMTRLTLSSA
jgi:hypothetical protein